LGGYAYIDLLAELLAQFFGRGIGLTSYHLGEHQQVFFTQFGRRPLLYGDEARAPVCITHRDAEKNLG